MILYCLRHGQAAHNITKKMNENPNVNILLTPSGIGQAQKASNKLQNLNIEAIFISEFPRVKQTAEIINKNHQVQIKTDSRLNEIKSGFEHQSVRIWQDFLQDDPIHKKKEGSESINDVFHRISEFMNDLKMMDYETVVIVTHGTPLRMIQSYFGQLRMEENPLGCPANAEILKFDL